MNNIVILKVGSNSNMHHLKTAIVGNIMSGAIVCIDGIGAGANYIALKSIIMAKGQLSMRNYSLISEPSYQDIMIDFPMDNTIKTGIRWKVKGVPNDC